MPTTLQFRAVELKQRQGERGSNEVGTAGSRAALLGPQALPPPEQHRCPCLICHLSVPTGLHVSALVLSRQKPSRPPTDTLFPRNWARLAVGEEPRDRPGWGREERSSREFGGLSQTCDSPAANSRVNLSVRASCWGWRQEEGSSRECGGLSQICDSPAANSRVNVSMLTLSIVLLGLQAGGSAGTWAQTHSPWAAGVSTAGPWLPCDLLVERSRGSELGTSSRRCFRLVFTLETEVAVCTDWSSLLWGSCHPSLVVAVCVGLLFPENLYLGFLGASVAKNPLASAGDPGDTGSIPGSGRSPGEGNGSSLQCSCLENPMDRGALWAAVHGVTQSDRTVRLNHHKILSTETFFLQRPRSQDDLDLKRLVLHQKSYARVSSSRAACLSSDS